MFKFKFKWALSLAQGKNKQILNAVTQVTCPSMCFFYNVGRYRRGKCLAHRERLAQRDLVCHMNVGWETD